MIALLLGVFVVAGSAQQAETPLYVVLTYLKVLPGQGDAYQAHVTGMAKKFYQEAMNVSPNLVHWSSARVMYKGIDEGQGQDFDYVSAAVTNGPPPEPGGNMDAIFAKLGTTQAEYGKKLSAMRTIVGTEVLRRIAGTSATGAGTSKEGDFRVSNQVRIKSGMGSEYTDRARTLTLPMMQEAVAQGDLKAWSLWGRVFPSGAATSYDVMGVTTHKSLASVLEAAPPEPRDGAVHEGEPGKELLAVRHERHRVQRDAAPDHHADSRAGRARRGSRQDVREPVASAGRRHRRGSGRPCWSSRTMRSSPVTSQ